jgi:hypothetical protein
MTLETKKLSEQSPRRRLPTTDEAGMIYRGARVMPQGDAERDSQQLRLLEEALRGDSSAVVSANATSCSSWSHIQADAHGAVVS